MNLFSLQGRTALITGSSRGLGHAIAEGFAQAGARLVLNGTNAAKVTESAQAMRAKGFDVIEAAFDVTDEAAICRHLILRNLIG